MWKAVLVAASGLLASPPAAADAVLHVDCALGDDAADGMTPQTPFRTIGRALDQLGEETGEVRIAAGTCPGEGGLRLGSRAALVGAGSSATARSTCSRCSPVSIGAGRRSARRTTSTTSDSTSTAPVPARCASSLGSDWGTCTTPGPRSGRPARA